MICQGHTEINSIESYRELLSTIDIQANDCETKMAMNIAEMEALKVDFFLQFLSKQKKLTSIGRGCLSVVDGENRLKILGGTLLSTAIGGLLLPGKHDFLISGAHGMIDSLESVGKGRIQWVVEFGERIRVIPLDKKYSLRSGKWMSWEILERRLQALRQRALEGEKLGDIDILISKLTYPPIGRNLISSPRVDRTSE